MTVVGQRAAEGDVVCIAARRVLHEEIGLGDRPGLRVHFLAEEVDVGLRVDRGPEPVSIPAPPVRDVLLGDHQHAAGAAAGVVDGAHHARAGDAFFVAREHEIHHQMDDVARGEVLAGVLVQGFVELAEQLFEDGAHRRVVDRARVQIDALEPLHHLEQEPRLVELADRVVEVEPFHHAPHVVAESGDVVPQIAGKPGGIREQPVEVVLRCVVEGESGSSAKLPVQLLEAALAQLRLPSQHPLLGRREHAVEAAQHRQGQDDVLVLAALEAVADEVRDPPDEADDLAVVHRVTRTHARAGLHPRRSRAQPPSERTESTCQENACVCPSLSRDGSVKPTCGNIGADRTGTIPPLEQGVHSISHRFGGLQLARVTGAGATGSRAARAGY